MEQSTPSPHMHAHRDRSVTDARVRDGAYRQTPRYMVIFSICDIDPIFCRVRDLNLSSKYSYIDISSSGYKTGRIRKATIREPQQQPIKFIQSCVPCRYISVEFPKTEIAETTPPMRDKATATGFILRLPVKNSRVEPFFQPFLPASIPTVRDTMSRILKIAY
ncbi:unnamed protein product, partial [Meganyctiphanes norvegica]